MQVSSTPRSAATYALAALFVVAVTAALLGCSRGAGPAASAPAQAGPSVTIRSMAFVPRTITVKVGSTVTWTNRDPVTHTVSGTGFVSGPIAPGKSYSHTFSSPGTYEYICTIHPSMVGIVVAR